MRFQTTDVWDEELWSKANGIYEEAFGKHHPKSAAIIRNMFAKGLCSLHVVFEEWEGNSIAIGMALTGKLSSIHSLVIDYLAVKNTYRNKGIGVLFVNYLKNWAQTEMGCDSMILEIEVSDDPFHHQRLRFWEKCGFKTTDYVHDYKVVPEPYQAMYQKLTPNSKISSDGRELFKHLSNFHRKCFQGSTKKLK
ncbi:GNAT family N-acetyltransferase [Schinkia sp. CFF1]